MHTKRASEVVYTSKDIINVALEMKQDINLIRKTSDPELIRHIRQAETIDFVQFAKDTKIPSVAINGREETDTVYTCHITNLK